MKSIDMCKFCYSNGEAESQYRSHLLKNSSGLVTCPVLRSFICPICKATGDFAHTQRYVLHSYSHSLPCTFTGTVLVIRMVSLILGQVWPTWRGGRTRLVTSPPIRRWLGQFPHTCCVTPILGTKRWCMPLVSPTSRLMRKDPVLTPWLTLSHLAAVLLLPLLLSHLSLRAHS